MPKHRIWELDALRGLCILGMLVFHLLYDATELFALLPFSLPPWLTFIADIGARVFLLLSGLCVTLGSHPIRRGLTVFGCAMACTLVTWLMYKLGFAGSSMVIRFGMLHCLGICMLLWPLLRRFPLWLLALLGAAAILAGGWLDASSFRVDSRWLFPLGLRYFGFSSGDYYPLLPGLGWFLIGSLLGKTLYGSKQSLLAKVPVLSFLCFFGRHSLPIYLLHQPIFAAILFSLKELL